MSLTCSLFTCPVCSDRLERLEKVYRCAAGHSYDIAAAGHVYLLLANQKHSAAPGDDKAMVRARADFLGRGYFRILRDALAEISLRYVADGGALLDSGCGEGYYTEGVRDALSGAGLVADVAGIDIAKYAVQLAAKRSKSIEFAVASSYILPVASGSLDVVLSCFAPVAPGEYFRALKPGGRLVVAQPAARHLWGLKSVLYDSPYENPLNDYGCDGFRLEDRIAVRGDIVVSPNADIVNLFRMTPYYWKTSVDGGGRLAALERLETEIGFVVEVYRREV